MSWVLASLKTSCSALLASLFIPNKFYFRSLFAASTVACDRAGVILIADCFGSLIWRVDLNTHDGKPKASVMAQA